MTSSLKSIGCAWKLTIIRLEITLILLIVREFIRRQRKPEPMLFNIVADMLAILIERAKIEGQIEGVVPHLVDGGLSILQYADDYSWNTILIKQEI
jgi:hypothetical protein